jgi:hypothetical protein
MKRTATKLHLITEEDASVWAMPDGPRHSRAEPVARLRPSDECRYRGHRTYLDIGERLISTRTHRLPPPRGHRAFIGKQEWR